jgi:autotransporter strand-loop-strand O-heptosyltransferase
MIYDNLVKNLNNKANIDNKVYFHFVRGAFLEIKGSKQAEYDIKFINNKNGRILYTTSISTNMWTRCNLEYFIEWRIEIYENGKLWFEHLYNAEHKRVYVALDSKALGDSLAWIPYVEEFGKVHNCKMVVSTFMNTMFESRYPNIEFVEPGTNVQNLYAMYGIGLFYNEDSTINIYKNPIDPKGQTMQKMCSDILGLEYKEIKPK